MQPSRPVAVIGGGFAGLAAATALAAAGRPVHVFEARPRLGGRAATFRDPLTGERIDNGQHVLAGCYTETLRFLNRIGAGARLHRPSTLRVPLVDEDGRRTALVLPPLPSPFHLLAGVLAWDALSAADRWSMLRVGRALASADRVRTDETVRQWLDRHGQSPRLCRLLWEPLALAALNQSIDEAAATSFVAVTSRMFSSAPDAATLVVPAVALEDLYVVPAARFLADRGSRIDTLAKAQLVFTQEGVAGVRVGGVEAAFSEVVCTVPWHALQEVCAAPPAALAETLSRASALGSSPIVTVNLWFDAEIDEGDFVGLPGRTFQWLFNRRRLIGLSQRHVSLVSSGAEAICAMANDELIAIAAGEVRAALPAARDAHLDHALVVRERRATFSLKPGSPQRPPTITAVAGLVLAGDWIDTGLPATIESAVMSGHRAAAAILG